MLRPAGLAVLLIVAWSQTAQADIFQDQRWCDDKDTHPDIRIGACTRNIQSGRVTGRNLAVVFYNRGNAYIYAGQFDRAIADNTEAIRIRPDFAEAFFNRGMAYAKKGVRNRIVPDFKKAYDLGFRDPLLLKTLRSVGVIPPSTPLPNIGGHWNTTDNSFGVVNFPSTVIGTITAPYLGATFLSYQGRIVGNLQDNLLTGVWVQDGSAVNCDSAVENSINWGKVELRFNADFTNFAGEWGYCDDRPTWQFNGTRS